MTSVLTFPVPLIATRFLSCTKEGRQNLYAAARQRKDYRQRRGVGFLRRLCGGSVKESGREPVGCGRALTEQDIDELRAFLDEADALRRDLMLQFSEKLLNNLIADRPDRIAGGARAAHSAAADEKALSGPYGMWCGRFSRCGCSFRCS